MNMAPASASIIDLRAYVDPSRVPTLVLVDLQQEYIATARALAVPGAAEALANCRAALTHARAKGFPVAFVRWLARSKGSSPTVPTWCSSATSRRVTPARASIRS